jgi:hypothetical protein
MSNVLKGLALSAVFAASSLMASAAQASLVTFQSYFGNIGLSSDGWGGSSGVGVVTANAPTGSTVIAAYLYTATFGTLDFSTGNFFVPTTVTFEGNAVNYVTSGQLPSPACCNLSSYRADVTSIVKSAIDGGAGGGYNFNISEGAGNSNIDGHALVVVYSNPALPEASIGILDGYANVAGDTTSINFADPLDPLAPDFFAEMRLGINFSCCNQTSRVEVNGLLLTENAGNADDGDNPNSNGSLITVGGDNDPFSPLNPTYAQDTERYDLRSFINPGDTSIGVRTFNASRDDNIFLAMFHVRGKAGFNEDPDPTAPIPLPAAGWLLLTGLGGLAAWRRRKTS